MPPAPPQGNQNESAAMGPVWVLVAISVFFLLIWYFGHQYVVWLYFKLKLIEIDICQFFTVGLEETKKTILEADVRSVQFGQVADVARAVGQHIRFPIAAFLLSFAMLLNFKASASRYQNVYNMKTLLNVQVQSWPQLVPVVNLDLIKKDIHNGPWAMAMQPLYFAKRYQLLTIERMLKQEGQLSKEATYKVSLIQNRVMRLFIMQLGQPWKGDEALPIHVKALFAAFAAKAARASSESRDFLNKLSSSAKEGQVDFSGTEALLKKYKNTPVVVEAIKKHAYVLTVMAALIEVARTDGVLPCAEFIWLKPIDRRLWLMLNCVGRQTAFVEVAGPFSHWLAEKELGKKIRSPMVDQAIKGLEEAIKEIKYNPEVK